MGKWRAEDFGGGEGAVISSWEEEELRGGQQELPATSRGISLPRSYFSIRCVFLLHFWLALIHFLFLFAIVCDVVKKGGRD